MMVETTDYVQIVEAARMYREALKFLSNEIPTLSQYDLLKLSQLLIKDVGKAHDAVLNSAIHSLETGQ